MEDEGWMREDDDFAGEERMMEYGWLSTLLKIHFPPGRGDNRAHVSLNAFPGEFNPPPPLINRRTFNILFCIFLFLPENSEVKDKS
jgi:hypothetical protein